MSVIISDDLTGWSKKAAINLLSSEEEIVQVPEADGFYVARSKHSDMVCIGKMNIQEVDFFILHKK